MNKIKAAFSLGNFVRPKACYLVPTKKILSVFWICVFSAIATGTSSYVGGILSNPIAATIGHSNFSSVLNIILATFLVLFGYLIGNLITPLFLKKIKAKHFLFIALVIQAIANILLSFIGINNPHAHFWIYMFGLFQLINGFGFGFAMTTINFLVISAFKNNKNSGSWLTKTHGAFGLGVVIISFISGIILTKAATNAEIWRIIFYITTVLLIISSIIIFFAKINENPKYFEENSKEQEAIRKVNNPKTVNSKKKWKINKLVMFFGFAMFFYLFLEDSITFYLNTAFRTSYEFRSNAPLLAILTGLFWLGITFGRWFFGIYLIGIKKWDKYKFIKFSILIVSIIYVLIDILLIVNNSEPNGNKANPSDNKPHQLFDAGKYIVLGVSFFIGLFCSAIYPLTVTIGIEEGKSATVWTTGYFVTMASLGGIVYDIFATISAQPSLNGIWWLPIIFPPILVWLVIVFIRWGKKYKIK